MPNRFAVMGNPIAHSLSPFIHQQFAEQTGIQLSYEKILVPEASFEAQVVEFFSHGGKGLNITLPFKQRAFALATSPTPRAMQAKAANTLWMTGEQLHADNTDGIGLIRDLATQLDLEGKQVLLLGAGGAARGVIGPLLAAGIAQLTVVNRTTEKATNLQADFRQIKCSRFAELEGSFDLIINATSASLVEATQPLEVNIRNELRTTNPSPALRAPSPRSRGEGENEGSSLEEKMMLPLAVLKPTTLCYDMAYSKQGSTAFVDWAHGQGVLAMDGLGMLVEQAAEAFFIWHGVRPDPRLVLMVLKN